MKNLKIILYILTVLVVSQCQKKSIDLELEETACKNFKLSNLTYHWNIDLCNVTSDSASVTLSFNYNGDEKCIDKIIVNPTFYRVNNSSISGVSYQGTFTKSDPYIQINNNSITITFGFRFTSSTDAKALNSIYFNIHTENDLGAKSNSLEARVNTNCASVDPSTYTVKATQYVSTQYITLYLWDYGSVDGDIVSVYLNGTWVINNYTLTGSKKAFNLTVPLNSGSNDLVVFADNQGSVGPNTCGIQVNSNGSEIELNPGLETGQAIKINF